MENSQTGGKGWLYAIIIILVVIIIGVTVFFVLKNQAGSKTNESATPTTPATTHTTPAITSTPTTSLSEQPDTAKFNEYFTEAYLSKLAIGEQIGPGNSTKTTVFDLTKDQFCNNFTSKKDIPSGVMAGAIYDVTNKTYIQEKAAYPMEFKQGGTSGCEPESWSAGQYEYKIYVSDILVAVLPFEIK